MVALDLRVVELMDERPLARAQVRATLVVVPRFPTQDPDGPKPTVVLEPDFRFAREIARTFTVGDDGRFTTGFNDLLTFRQVAQARRPERPQEARDAVGFIRVGAQFLGIDFADRFVAREIPQRERVEATVHADLGTGIVGHTTPTTARLWFHVPFDLTTDHELSCSVVTEPIIATGGPPRPGTGLGRSFPVELDARANTAVIEIGGLSSGRRHEYALVLRHRGRSFTLVQGGFKSPRPDQTGVSFAFGSCHLPVEFPPFADPVNTPNRSLGRWRRLADERDHEFTILTGDQIYADGIERKWPRDTPFQQYVNRYRQLWAYRPTRQALRSAPTYMILDDHDVADDFGIDNLDDAKVRAAFESYDLFQHAHNPGPLDRGANVGPYHYSFRWGPAAFFVMDGRSQRGQGDGSPTFGRQQLEDLRQWARSPVTRAADVIFFVAPVPPALLPTELIRQTARQITVEAVTTAGTLAGLALGGPFGGVVLGGIGHELGDEVFERHVERSLLLNADLGERWDLRENQPDLRTLLDVLFDLSSGVGESPPRKRAVFILSGDIHAGTMHLIRSLPIGDGRRHAANPVITQLTSSSISRVPVDDDLWTTAVSKVDDDFDFGLRDLVRLKLANPLTDWADVAARGIEEALGDGQGRYTLDPNLERRFVCENTGLVMERTVGFVRIERRDPARRAYRFHLAIEGESKTIASDFDLDLDADEVVPVLRNAAFVARQGPVGLSPLRPADVAITMRNTGATPWTTGFALDIAGVIWGVDRVPVTATVLPGRTHTFRFRIVAPSSGTFPFSARMVAPGNQLFGASTPPARFTATIGGTGGGGGSSCTELRQEHARQQQQLRQLQASLADASPAEKPQINADIRVARAAINAITARMASQGCGAP